VLAISMALALVISPAEPAATPVVDAEDALEKMVCKRTTETGSLIKGKKVCLTRREWYKLSENGRAMGHQMQERNAVVSGLF
jgi:hypothetical protein